MTTLPADGDLDAYVQRIVADWPALTPEQRDRVEVLLQPTPSPATHKAA